MNAAFLMLTTAWMAGADPAPAAAAPAAPVVSTSMGACNGGGYAGAYGGAYGGCGGTANDCCDTGAQCGCNGAYGTTGYIGGTAEPIPAQPKPAGGAPMPSKPTSTTPMTMSGVITNVTPVAAPASPF